MADRGRLWLLSKFVQLSRNALKFLRPAKFFRQNSQKVFTIRFTNANYTLVHYK